MIETATFTCSICSEPSTEICAHCTKDACSNHRCERCKRCSDCCECEVPLTAPERKIMPAPYPGAEPAIAEPMAADTPMTETTIAAATPPEPEPLVLEPVVPEPQNSTPAPEHESVDLAPREPPEGAE